MNKTEHLGLNQWALEDPIKMEDFNRDNALLDAALAGAASALGGKLGRSEIIEIRPSSGILIFSNGWKPHVSDWSEWEYVCALFHFPKEPTGTTDKALAVLHASGRPDVEIGPFPLSGYMIVFLPRHDADARVAGFILADRFVPFSLDYSFRELVQVSVLGSDNGSVADPDVAYFGGK